MVVQSCSFLSLITVVVSPPRVPSLAGDQGGFCLPQPYLQCVVWLFLLRCFELKNGGRTVREDPFFRCVSCLVLFPSHSPEKLVLEVVLVVVKLGCAVEEIQHLSLYLI